MLTDSHCHLDFYDDPAAVLARAAEAGVERVLAIGIGDGPATMHRALGLAKMYPRVWASVGIHPQEAHQATAEALAALRALAEEERCLAVGEIGLDYYHLDNPGVEVQQAAFVAQMRIAAELRKPILIHCRTSELAVQAAKERFGAADAFEDLMRLVRAHWVPAGVPGVMHCFSGSSAQGREAIEAGFYLSFAGNVTYPKALGIRDAARDVPEERLLVETDAPFLAPVPHRGKGNEPALMVHTVEALAELRGVSRDEVVRVTSANFERLFPAAGMA